MRRWMFPIFALLGEALRVGKTLIVQAGALGSDLGRLDLMLEKDRITDYQ